MKVLLKFSNKTEVIDNVSVDDRCLPIMSGLHPYTASALTSSPLVLESALWFKTLAVDAVYIDCDARLIFWAPVDSEINTPDAVMRHRVTPASGAEEFIPTTAKPLFRDRSIYDLDASLKEMMGKCSEAMLKYFKKSLSAEEFHRIIAQILHIYVLPSITFTESEVRCLTRAKRLVEMRLVKAENEITKKASVVENLKKCLFTLKNNLLLREDLDSERYLRTCKRDFLVVFLKTVELDIMNLNLELTAEQSKINWSRKNPNDVVNLSEVKERRDGLFNEISQLIRVREAIKNVISRRELTKRKVKKVQIVNSCFHNIFVEIMRRLELEENGLGQLGNDKVNICATREAVICALVEIVNNNRNSDRATKFEPEDFADFSVSEGNQVEKSGVWLTFQERVARVLENVCSAAFTLHKDGCKSIISKINLALSEFQLAKRDGYRFPQHHQSSKEEKTNSRFYVSLHDVTLRDSKVTSARSKKREATLISNTDDSFVICDPNPSMVTNNAQTFNKFKEKCETDSKCTSFDRKAYSTMDINVCHKVNQTDDTGFEFNGDLVKQDLCEHLYKSPTSVMSDDEKWQQSDEESDTFDSSTFGEYECSLRRQRHIMTEQLAVGSLMNSIENLKAQMQNHFKEVIKSLDQELRQEEIDHFSGQEHKELLWKSYERFFCQEVYAQLMDLYITGLTLGVRKAYEALRKTSIQDILEDDKLLDLFFGGKEVTERSISIPNSACSHPEDKISMARTLSRLSLDMRCCDVKELYTLANADGDDLCKRFNLDSIECDDDLKTSSSDSVKSDELSNDEDTCEMTFDSPSVSTRSATSSASLDNETFSDTEKNKIHSRPESVVQILEPVMSPFLKAIKKCFDAVCFLDKVRYITKAIEGLNSDISKMIGPNFQSACDDIISMLVLALYSLPEDMFISLYINLRLLMDVMPDFLNGTLWEYNLVTLYASYDFLFSRKVCQLVIRQYPGSLKVKR